MTSERARPLVDAMSIVPVPRSDRNMARILGIPSSDLLECTDPMTNASTVTSLFIPVPVRFCEQRSASTFGSAILTFFGS
jgi:hypothetical protein